MNPLAPARRIHGAAALCRRSRAALVALLFVLAHFGSLSHLAAVRHEVCDEHGQLEHAASAAAHGAKSDGAGARLDAARPGSSGDHHESCHLSLFTKSTSFTRPADSPRGLVDPGIGSAPIDRVPRAPASIPVLLLAPKHSPPAAS
jgi:hypothetical protein